MSKTLPKPSEILRNKFEHEPTKSQARLFSALDTFLESRAEKPVFLLKGYAGTGKTTTIGVLIKVLPLFNLKFVLLAPTGRAAKVMSQYARKTAFTIHKKIYKTKSTQDTGPVFSRVSNYHTNTVFIVDEASMINATTDMRGTNLLDDLMDFVFEKKGNSLLFVGDLAQLPPVKSDYSLALDADHLKRRYQCHTYEATLVDITRQSENSGILLNATSLRNELNKTGGAIKFATKNHTDIYRMNAERMQDGIQYAYDKYGVENSLIICRSNRSAVMYNHFIRNTLFFKEEELDAGDLLLIARNNYTFVDERIPSGFLANGDFMEVRKIKRYEEMHGFRFADAEVSLTDYDSGSFEAKLLLDTLHDYSPALSQEQNTQLYQSVLADYQELNRKERMEAMKKDPYLNALQVKYAYAMTCHKAQGGQWDAVFVDQGYLPEDQNPNELIRWIYTAVTRAKKELFLVNFDTKFF